MRPIAAAIALLLILGFSASAIAQPTNDPAGSVKSGLQLLLMRAKQQWTPRYFAAGDTPDGARADVADESPMQAIARMRVKIEALRATNPDVASKAGQILDGLEQSMKSRIDAETKCRATPACMGERIAALACSAISDRRGAAQAIVDEKKNPAGVIDLVKLHDLGQAVQDLDARIATWKKQYLATMKKPFTERLLCSAAAPAASP